MPDSAFPLTRATTVPALQAVVTSFRKDGARIAFVPTMGALHEGHLALVRHAKTRADKVVVSIFVNPLQFGPTEDLARYPRNEAGDIALLQGVGCDLVYLPTVDVLYPDDFVSRIELKGPALGLETDFRPQFFSGVATVVMKLFNQVRPDLAVFGEKDFQQLSVVRAMVRDFDLGLEIVPYPTMREADGLALSSRNAYLSADERAVAPKLHAALETVRSVVQAAGDTEAAIARAKADLTAAGFGQIDYIALRDAETLGEVRAGKPRRLLAALWLGKTRLIDNIAV
ncbi:pantoate--beta-alanine ligase [Asticcacaulis biprosthecium C19]|uniref:Pantothenate synthetase n=1 Tax=Asticcacaulis biprosthecium C19 TaxID=715226 RepID=F4QRL7_9CAUL|nr:pantoate--beta-alanine ligase [Asticcacaulis biprosthecium]EGF90143.1 pantoate--beta-alanine ligase [Asticcacaulis biprosthecium C19]